MTDFARERQRMIEHDLEPRGIHDPAVLAAMAAVPREEFVDPPSRSWAYLDRPLAIDEEQTISQPFIVAYMVMKAEVRSHDRVLEVGTGSGYAAAVLAQLAQEVYTIERFPSLARQARGRFQKLGYQNVHSKVGDGSRGWPEASPFDVIVVSAAASEEVPPDLLSQLAVGGRLIVPVGQPHREQRLIKVVRRGPEDFQRWDLGPVQFVPLIEQG
jgi:protein-L-isoaspartate(D-aspartate) O-methyltransferase